MLSAILQTQQTVIPVRTETHIPHELVIACLKTFRKEWQEAAGEASLLDTHASVGLVLVDMCIGMKLTKAEMIDCLGFDAYAELTYLIENAA